MSPSRRRGFVLPTTLLVVTLLTVMLTTAFILVSAEHRASENAFESTRALALAQAGLQTYLSRPTAIDSTVTFDSTRIAFSGGHTDVVSQELVPPRQGRPALWVVRAAGYVTGGLLGGTPQAKRAVAVLAELQPGFVPARAAMVAPNGVHFLGNGTNPLDGDDACAQPSDTTAVTVPAGTLSDSATSGPRPAPTPAEELASWSAVYDSSRLDWSRLVIGDFAADYMVGAPCVHGLQTGSAYLAGYCDGDAILPAGNRHGLLVVTGNVTIDDGARWDGVLLIGGRLLTPGGGGSTYRLRGLVVTGLSMSQGTSVAANRVRRGNNRSIQFASCLVRQSTVGLTSFVPLPSGWVGSWSQY